MPNQARVAKVLAILLASMTIGATVLMALGHNPPSAGPFSLWTYYRLDPVSKAISSQAARSPVRWNRIEIFYSGTQTGNLPQLTSAHYSLVEDYDIDANHVTCRGPVRASSETLTHAAIFELTNAIRAVVHVHHEGLWRRLQGKAPTTHAKVRYGTPEMAKEFRRLYVETDFAATRIAVMAGHIAGLISIGEGLHEAGQRLLDFLPHVHTPPVFP